MRKWIGAILVLALGCTTSPSEADKDAEGEGEVAVALDDVPAVVLDAARKAVPGITLTSAEKETENGVVVYDIEGTAEGKRYEVEVDEKGNVLDVEDGPDDDDDGPDDDDGEDD